MKPTTLSPVLKRKMEEFLSSSLRNCWIHTPQMQVYVRKGHHIVNRHHYLFLDIANIIVYENYRRKGLFKQTLDLFLHMCGAQYQGVYVESVHNPGLATYLETLSNQSKGCYWNPDTRCFSWLKGGE